MNKKTATLLHAEEKNRYICKLKKSMAKTKQIGVQARAATVAANSYNEAENTVEVVFATDTPVMRTTWDGTYYEVLSIEASAMRMERINAGAPVLANHYNSIGYQLGKVERAWIENGQAKAMLRFSKREDVQGIIQDIKDGIITNVSVGYRVYEYEEKAAPTAAPSGVRKETTPTYIARDWEPYEISMVAMPADYKAGVRSEIEPQPNEVTIISRIEEKPMPTENSNTPPVAPNAPTAEDVKRSEEAGKKAERERIIEIRNASEKVGLSADFYNKHIEGGTSVEDFRKAAFDELAKNNPKMGSPTPDARVQADEVDKRRAAMSDALEGRAAGKIADGKNEYRGMSLLRMAGECVERAGGNTRHLTDAQIARAALNIDRQRAGMHTTSDFPIILGNTIDRNLRRGYELQARSFVPFTTRRTVRDFREITDVQLSELVGGLDKIPEGGAYKYATLAESKEVYRLAKYGKKIAVTWETIINDDLGAFSRVPTLLANQVAQMQSKIVYDILLTNPNMGDGNALFSTAHGNIAASGTTISEASLEAMFIAMRNQKDLNGTDLINVVPAFLVVGPAREVLARKFMSASFQPNTTSDINIFAQSMQIIVDPRITGNKWYAIANPNQLDTIETAVLEGEGEIYTEQREGFDVDGLEIKIRSTFAAKAKDWRGMYYNAGN